MKEIAGGLIGVLLGLSIAANAALLYNAYNQEDSWLNNLLASRTQQEQTETQAAPAEEEAPVTQEREAIVSAPQNGLALYTSSRMPTELSDNLFKSVHSMVYDNEAVFYIAYSNEVAANEAGYNRNRADYDRQLNNLWAQNLNRFLAKNKEFSDSLKRYDSKAYATFIIVDDDDHEKILAILSDGVLYYNIGAQPDIDPFSLYDTRWNKYIRRDLSELLDDPLNAQLPPRSTDPNRNRIALTNTFTDDTGTLRFVSYQVVPAYGGGNCLVLYCEFENKSSGEISFFDSGFHVEVYQDKEQKKGAHTRDTVPEAYDYTTKVKPQEKRSFALVYELGSFTPAEVNVNVRGENNTGKRLGQFNLQLQ